MVLNTEVLIIGGGFAGVSVVQALAKKGIRTILVDQKNYFEVTFATLRNLAAPEITKEGARKRYADFISGEFIQKKLVELSPNKAKLEDDTEITFKRVVIASGSRYPSMSVAKSNKAMDIQHRNEEFNELHRQLKTADNVLVVGGGVVGVELAGEIAYAFPDKKVTLAHNRSSLLDGFKKKAQQKSADQLKRLGVEIEFNRKYKKVDDDYIDQNTGKASTADLVYEAIGAVPNNEFLKMHLPHILTDKGYVKVNDKLEVIGQEHHYALGDIADVGEGKLGYLAQQQGVHLARSIINSFADKPNKIYKRNPLMALVPTGQKSGVVQLPFAVTTMKLLVNMKQKDLFVNKIYKSFGVTD